jgi:mRNA-degrading endonuclease RelE of RelBE toxin-antitoxin system
VYEVEITPEGLRHLNLLPERIREAALSAVFGPIAENPRRLGKPLLGELEGLTVARRGDYRIIYEILEEEKVIVVHRIQHRKDVYRSR